MCVSVSVSVSWLVGWCVLTPPGAPSIGLTQKMFI